MANINLLPWREQRRDERKHQFIVLLSAMAVFAALLIFVADRYVNKGISNQNALNEYLTQQIAALDREIVEIRELQEQKKALTERMAVIQDLQGKRPVIVRLFDELVRTLPEGVYFNSVTRVEDSISLRGEADSNGHVSTLMRSLDESDWFANPDLRQVTALPDTTSSGLPGETARNSFELTVTVTTGEGDVEP